RKGAAPMHSFTPAGSIAIGGGSTIDAAHNQRVLYAHPDTHFADLALRFMDIRTRICLLPKMCVKENLIAVKTTTCRVSDF
ncbi:hypothetical protein LXA48_18170, partial [Erwinia amylovora]|nr:hypothetical protein [Erwinia amylovora]